MHMRESIKKADAQATDVEPHRGAETKILGVEAEVITQFFRALLKVLNILLNADDKASRDDMVETIAIHEELSATARRVLGPAHPTTNAIQDTLEDAQKQLASCDK